MHCCVGLGNLYFILFGHGEKAIMPERVESCSDNRSYLQVLDPSESVVRMTVKVDVST